jgi:hypothetical protein
VKCSLRILLLGSCLVTAGVARTEPRAVYVASVGDFSGHGSGRTLRDDLETALRAAEVPLAPTADVASIAQQAGVALDRVPSDEAAARLAFQAALGGVLVVRPAKHHQLSVSLIDGQGRHLMSSELQGAQRPGADELSGLAGQVSGVLRASVAPEPIAIQAPAPVPRAPAPDLIPMLRASLAPALATRTYSLPGIFSYQNSSPYGALAVSAEVFPFDEPILHGLGLMGDFQFGLAKAQMTGMPSFQQSDVRFDLGFAYRGIPVTGPYGPAIQGALSVGYRAFSGSSSSGIPDDDRVYFGLGLAVIQPILPRLLRVEGAFTWMPVANASTPVAPQQSYGSSTGSGFEWSATLAGLPLGPIEFALRVDQQRFSDSYPASEGVAAATGSDVLTSYLLAVQYIAR